jgi:hypothetical protein
MTRSSYFYSALFSSLLLFLPYLVVGSSSLLPSQQLLSSAGGMAKYHSDHSCDRAFQNAPEQHSRVSQRHEELQASATGVSHVPNEQTVTCPLFSSTTANNKASSLYPTDHHGDVAPSLGDEYFGMPVTWLVENHSKVPVVIAFVDFINGQEFSAVDPDVTPPQADPQAILMPHEWTTIWTQEGHVFHVYELLEEATSAAGNINYQLGRLVLQHRVGMIPIQKTKGNSNTNNSSFGGKKEEEDMPCHDMKDEPSSSSLAEETLTFSRDRTTIKFERCNVLYRGFRNMGKCPVHAHLLTGTAETATTTTISSSSNHLPFREDFKFHLGVNGQTNHFHDWDSTTKFQRTFVGQTYIFRLASHPSMVVDTYTVTPTRVVDCPGQDSANPPSLRARQVSVSGSESVVMPLLLLQGTTNTSGATIIDTKKKKKKKLFTLLTLPKNVTTSVSDHHPSSHYECYANSDCRPISAAATTKNVHHPATATTAL